MECRICGVVTRAFFSIPTVELDETFLNSELRQRLSQLQLGQCCECGSLWAHDPRTDDSVLMDAYARLTDSYFEPPAIPEQYKQFYRSLEQLAKRHAPGKTVLDVGCGDGLFLESLSNEWVKWGIEPSPIGVELARKRSLNVACGTLDNSTGRYGVDLVCALDVIEHVLEPHSFLEAVKHQLNPGGIVLILTGDSTSLPARIAGAQWSYLRWCGHVSVFSARGLQRILRDHGFQILAWKRCHHPASPGLVAWWRVHLLEPARRALGRNRSWYPFWRDHQAVVARLT